MELEYFIKPDEVVELISGRVTTLADNPDLSEPKADWGWQVWHKYWVEKRKEWIRKAGLPESSSVEYWQKPDELAHYARAAWTSSMRFRSAFRSWKASPRVRLRPDPASDPFGQDDGGLRRTAEARRQRKVGRRESRIQGEGRCGLDRAWGKTEAAANVFLDKLFDGKYIPHVIEPSAGVDRMALALMCNAYDEETVTDEKGKSEIRTVLRFSPMIAPIKVAGSRS